VSLVVAVLFFSAIFSAPLITFVLDAVGDAVLIYGRLAMILSILLRCCSCVIVHALEWIVNLILWAVNLTLVITICALQTSRKLRHASIDQDFDARSKLT
jgi:hypothetical protein